MGISFILLLFLIGLVGSFMSGMLGVGEPLLITLCYYTYLCYLDLQALMLTRFRVLWQSRFFCNVFRCMGLPERRLLK